MFEGSLTYGAYRYNVHGFDNVGSCRLVISSMSYNAVEFLGKKELWERHVDIKSGAVSIEGSKDEDLNMDFFCRLGALISYMKTACIRTNEEGYTGLNYASNEFVPKPDRWYNIPNVGRVKLSYGVICEVHVSTPFFTLDLAPTNTEFLIPTLKNGVRSGFHFDKEYLGFDSNLTENLVQSISEGVTYLADGTKIKTVNGMFTCIEDIIKAHPNKEFSWLLHKDYRIVTDDTLEDVCNYIMSWKGYVYYDTETSGLELNFYSRIGQADQVVGIILSVKYGESFFFPMQMKAIPNLCGGDHKYFMERYMRPILEGKDIVAHNAPFDWKAAYIYDINANIVHDTMIIIKLTLGTVNTQYPLSLKANASTLLGRDSLELSDLVVDDSWGESDVRFWDLPYELVRLYACADTDNTAGLLEYAEQTDLLNKYGASKVYEIELAFGLAVAYQEFYGHRLDVNHIDTIRDEVKRGIADLKAKMVDIAGRDFNPNSPRDLLQIMYHDLGIPEQINRKTGKPSTDKFALKYLASLETLEGETMYPFAKYLKEYRELEGIRKTVDKFPEYLTDDGYIFSEVKQFGADTGRVSITKPNYQSYNDVIKKNVIPREGYWMFDTDYSSVEYRVLGSMVGNKSIIENFRDPDFDYHAYQASHMYRVPYAQVTAPLRKAAKSINFGLPYGMGDESLGATVFGEATPENTRKAGALRNAYFKGQEDIRDWFEYHRNRGVTEGYTETYFGRRRYYPKAENSVGSIKRKAGNFVIQGTAADIYKTAVGRVFKRICREGWLGKVLFVGFIHDELLGEVSNEIDPMKFLKVLREEFEVKVDGWCPLYMGFGFGTSWYEAKKVELPIKLQWEFVEKYGETGYPDWDGNARKFCDNIPNLIREYRIRDTKNQLLAPENQGKEIKPALNKELIDLVKEDSEIYSEVVSSWEQDDFQEVHEVGETSYLNTYYNGIVKNLEEKYISDLYSVDGVYQPMSPISSDTQEAIDIFCKLHKIDRSLINIESIEEQETSGLLVDDSDYDYGFDEELDTEEKIQRMIDSRVDTLGMYLDTDNKMVICLLCDAQYMNFIQSHVNRNGDGYKIRFKDNHKNMLYDTQAWLSSENIPIIQQMYIQYMKSLGK